MSAEALYDTGAAVTLISEEKFRCIPVDLRPKKREGPFLTLLGADKKPMQVKGCFDMPINLLNRNSKTQVFVVSDLSSDMILGTDFIRKEGLSYDAVGHRLFFDRTDQWQCGGMVASCEVTIKANSSQAIKVRAHEVPGRRATGPSVAVATITATQLPIAGNEGLINIDEQGNSTMMVDNLLDNDVVIKRGTFIGSVEKVQIEECQELTLDMEATPRSTPPQNTPGEKDKMSFLRDSIREQTKELSPELQSKYESLILKNHDIFSRDKMDLGRTNIMQHSIKLKDNEPTFVKQFRIPESHRSVLIEHLNNWIKLGVVSPSRSKYNSPIFCVPKKDGSLRPVLDFRSVNAKSHIDKYSQREVQDCIDELGRAQSTVFSSLDLTAGFWQLPLEKESRQFTAFTIPGLGSFQWNCTPMGLLGSPATFGRMMDFIMRFLSCITYQDDVLVHSKDHEQQLVELQKAFDRIRAHGLKLNVKKCSFGQSNVPYLGFLLTPTGILPGTEKTAAIRDCPPPRNVKQVKEFVGLCNYFRASVPNFSQLSCHLTALTRNDSKWTRGVLPEKAMKAFEEMKARLLDPPTLAYPNPKLEYHLMVDASVGSETIPGGVGASLIQIDTNGVPRAVGFASRGLSKHEKNYSAYLLELQAACFGIEYFDVYLRGRKFSLYTDHRPLEKLSTVHTRTLNRLQHLMLDYNFVIKYKPGKENVVADFLSRNPIAAVDVTRDTLAQLQTKDGLISRLITDLENDSQDRAFKRLKPNLVLKGGILFYKRNNGKMAIFAPRAIINDILQSAHNSLLGGHMGMFKSRERILERYYWPTIDKDVKEHIKSCHQCQSTKPHSRPNRVPLKPLEQPNTPNHRVHVDLFGPLTSSEKGKKYIMVMTDAFTKYVELVALPNKEASVVAQAIYECWLTRYSTPKEIVTDGGKEFSNKLLKGICEKLSILHKQTSPYHPECNAAVEVFNRTMRQFLQATIAEPFVDWEPLLPALRISYNTSVSKATLATPFSLVFGMQPNMPFFDLETAISYDEEQPDLLKELQAVRKIAERNNIEYRKKYQAYYDMKFKTENRPISLSDMIFVENMYKTGANPKLQPSWLGPYPVVKIKEQNIYYKAKNKVKVAHFNRVKTAYTIREEGSQMVLPEVSPGMQPALDSFSDNLQTTDNYRQPLTQENSDEQREISSRRHSSQENQIISLNESLTQSYAEGQSECSQLDLEESLREQEEDGTPCFDPFSPGRARTSGSDSSSNYIERTRTESESCSEADTP